MKNHKASPSPKVAAWLAASISLILIGCGGGDDDSKTSVAEETAPNTYSALYSQVFGSTKVDGCSTGECHNGVLGGPSFRNKAAFYTAATTQQMGNQNWDNLPVPCESLKMIEPSTPEKSVLLSTTVPNTDPSGTIYNDPNCQGSITAHANNHKVTITGAKAKGLVEWIRAGAANN